MKPHIINQISCLWLLALYTDTLGSIYLLKNLTYTPLTIGTKAGYCTGADPGFSERGSEYRGDL